MSALPPKADIRPRDQDVCFGPIVLQKDFGPRSEEHFFQIRPQERSLIQKFGHSDSNIARFWRSGGCRRLLQHNRPLADIPPIHSMTSSALASSEAGIVTPNAFAALRLMTSTAQVAVDGNGLRQQLAIGQQQKQRALLSQDSF